MGCLWDRDVLDEGKREETPRGREEKEKKWFKKKKKKEKRMAYINKIIDVECNVKRYIIIFF